MSHMIGVHQTQSIAKRNGCTTTSAFTKGLPKYALVFSRDGAEIGRAQVENFDASGMECVSMDVLAKLFPSDPLVDFNG